MLKGRSSKPAQEWIEKAEEDFSVAILLFQERKYPASICFHLHQASEKFLKSLIMLTTQEIRQEFKIHNLPKLYGYAKEACKELSCSLKENCFLLNKYYIATRYPGDVAQYPWEEVEEAIDAADNIRQVVLQIINNGNKI